jgi:hypothetical protein
VRDRIVERDDVSVDVEGVRDIDVAAEDTA